MPAASPNDHSPWESSLARRRGKVLFAAVLVLALVVRVGLVAATPGFHPRGDSPDYDRHARSISDGEGYPRTRLARGGTETAFRPPLYPHFLAAVYKVTGGRYTAARVAQSGLGVLTVALIALIAWQLWGTTTALIGGAIAAVFPPLLLIDESLLSETLFLPLVLGAVAAVLFQRRSPHRLRWAAAAGVLAGLAALTRSNAPVICLPLAIGVWDGRPRLSRAALAPPLVMVLAAAVTICPWTIRNFSAMDRVLPLGTQAGYTLAGTYNDLARTSAQFPAAWRPDLPPGSRYARLAARPDLDEAELESEVRATVLNYIRDRPGYVAKVGFWNTVRLLQLDGRSYARIGASEQGFSTNLADVGTYSWWGLGVLALLGGLTPAARRVPAFFWLVPLSLATTVFVVAFIRMRAPLDPFFVMLAALALAGAAERNATRRAATSTRRA